MAKRSNEEKFFEEDDFVPVKFARNRGEAERLKTLLEDHDIKVIIPDEDSELLDEEDRTDGIPLLVPVEHLSQAEEILEDRELLDEEFCEQLEGFDSKQEDDEDPELSELSPDEMDPDFESNADLFDMDDDEDFDDEEGNF